MNNTCKKILNSMNYNTYNVLNIVLSLASTNLYLSNLLFFDYNLIINLFVILCSCTDWGVSVYLNKNNGYIYTKDIKKIRELYDEFIKNYNKLNKVFDFNDPVSIHVMFSYLLYKGYLSSGKSFEFSEKGTIDLVFIEGANVISGHGVCRHIASMLTDILNDNNMNTVNIDCYKRYIQEAIGNIVSEEEYSREKNIDFINAIFDDDAKREEMLLQLKEYEDEGTFVDFVAILEEFKVKNGKKISNNHLICFTEYNGYNYYLDPTNGRIYRLNENGNLYDACDDKIIITNNSFDIYNLFNDKELMYMKDKSESIGTYISLGEQNKIINSVKSLCNDNIDIFERFYNENNELYNEISDKLSKIRAKRNK